MHILGISAYYHDSAACLLRDGEIIAAAQEERFTRRKHDSAFPSHAVEYCLREAGISAAELDLVAFYDKPLLKLDRLLETYLAYAPRGFAMFLRSMPVWLTQKLHIPRELDRGLGGAYKGRYVFLEHHESHAASAFFPSPFEEAAILTMDGVGEWATTSIAVGRGNRIEMLEEMRFPHSLGLLYSAFTYLAGFKVNSGEYKLMGLAPYGEPIYRDVILRELMDLNDDGSFTLNMAYFAYGYADVMISPKLAQLFGGPARKPEAEITAREKNLAASIQAVTEEVVMRMALHAYKLTGCTSLALAGGVALNCVANGKLLREGPFERLWVQPAAGDAGGALGAAMFAWHQLFERPRNVCLSDAQHASLLGPSFSHEAVCRALDGAHATYEVLASEEAVASHIAALLAAGKVVGHFAGRAEFGPRALGNRSIFGDARVPDMQSVMNLKIKHRESFRPFAPAVLRTRAYEFFDVADDVDVPYMQVVARVWEHKRSEIPAVTHVDGTARMQTVDERRNPRFHAILKAFERHTGCPMLINTSFNVRGEPIVNTPEDAYRCFMATDMDALVVERCVLVRAAQPVVSTQARVAHLAQFPSD